MEKKMIERINKEIKFMVEDYKATGKYDVRANAEIRGMMEMLVLVTGKDYRYNENGVYEKC